MLCERCKYNEATVHLTEIIKEVKSEVHLCESCAGDIGLNAKLANFSLSVPEMLSFLNVSEVDENAPQKYCISCGMTIMDYKKVGKLGCVDCYVHLLEPLRAIIAGYHGDSFHIGKHPRYTSEIKKPVPMDVTLKEDDSIPYLKKILESAVLDEKYEEAAEIRDRIRALERKNGELPIA